MKDFKDEQPMAPMTDTEKMRYWWNHIPDSYQGAYRRVWKKAASKQSMRAAVNAKCHDCMNWDQVQVKLCDIITCPLWQYRPLQKRESTQEAEVRAIAAEIDKPATEGSL